MSSKTKSLIEFAAAIVFIGGLSAFSIWAVAEPSVVSVPLLVLMAVLSVSALAAVLKPPSRGRRW
ncbi:hypothetical protein ACFQ08_20620 [Streptosporangium algeriense]|uniref:Uncharacterized protein n=1 Tax=Streptosporangium algeriense TaxID=1682748 RepID=A0ABW3DW44_9ACTN